MPSDAAVARCYRMRGQHVRHTDAAACYTIAASAAFDAIAAFAIPFDTPRFTRLMPVAAFDIFALIAFFDFHYMMIFFI